MKKQLLALFGLALSLSVQSQTTNESVKLKQIKSVETNTLNGDKITKTYSFQDGKLTSIKTSDLIQSFFYNKKGILDKTVKEREGSTWKEVASYFYDESDRLVKFTSKYEEGDENVTKTVTFKHEGSRIIAITKNSNSSLKFTKYIDYVVENGKIIRESERNLSQKIINKKEMHYYKDNLSRYKGLVGDKSIDNYTYDDKNSAMLLLVKNVFGENYQTIVPLIAPHENEFPIESISYHNFLNFSSTATHKTKYGNTYTYNNLNFPKTHTQNKGKLKTVVSYEYE
ncbi:hypothetical protein SY27_07195 [Flavobacterium sp. 316]|uniref:hypothetical protein n=1 Tax=Flavobacterium sp. 316 TaxID=1603293 RepID=UPI0005E9AA49|nr:hypothetical protein [Flavobacterium sp. 316]KIX21485.1 hypothetical protein SY27_07195 [Flavobacterium sp. 316]